MVRCAECPAEYHVSCAWKQGYKFGFEMQPVRLDCVRVFILPPEQEHTSLQVRQSRRDTTTIVEFNDISGCMTPVVICKGHIGHKRELFDICATNELGEVSIAGFIGIHGRLLLI